MAGSDSWRRLAGSGGPAVRGDAIVVEAYHRRAADEITRALAKAISARRARYVITVAGESGSGKSETALAIADALLEGHGLRSVVLGQDDYFVLPPRSNDARRRADPEWLGPHHEVRLDVLQANVDAARAGRPSIEKPLIDYEANEVGVETVPLDGTRVLIVEGTYVSLLRHVDCRVFIARNRLETLAHRRKRNRGGEAADPFVEQVLEAEHRIIAGHVALADVVLTRDYDVVFQR
jgi:uridine kinase